MSMEGLMQEGVRKTINEIWVFIKNDGGQLGHWHCLIFE